MRDRDGKTKCFGFINFENADDAARATEALNGKKFVVGILQLNKLRAITWVFINGCN